MAIIITERDEKIFLDIYDFGYVDFHYLWPLYWNDIEDEHAARVSINRRMKKLADENYIYPIVFRSTDNHSVKGRFGNVFTLAGKGISYVERLNGDKESVWDPNRKYRKGVYIDHHLKVAHLSMQTRLNCPRGYQFDVRGEKDAAYRVVAENQKVIKNIFLPDAVWFLGKGDLQTPIFVEYERTVRRSIKKMNEKMRGQYEYFSKGLYKEHDVLKSFPTQVSPILLYISNEKRTSLQYQKLAASEKYQTWSSYDHKSYCNDVLFTSLEDYLCNPYGEIFTNSINERKSLLQSVNVASFGHNLTFDKQSMWYPSRFATFNIEDHVMVLDGLAVFQLGNFNPGLMFKYLNRNYSKKIDSLSAALQKNMLNNHPYLKNSVTSEQKYNPKLVFLVEEKKEIENIVSYLITKDWGNQISQVLVACIDDVISNPVKSEYFDIGSRKQRNLF